MLFTVTTRMRLPLPRAIQLRHQDTGFQRFAKADSIRNQDALAGTLQRKFCRIQLVWHGIHSRFVANMQICVSGKLLPPLTF